MKRRRLGEKFAEGMLLGSAFLSVLAVAFITWFLFQSGLPLCQKTSIFEFLFSTNWSPTAEVPHYGVLSFIVGS
ncbi:MAG: phosphate ABC transporter permease subunit PstC, partial [Spirochaetota bacterium]